jgi:hypothetical protein
MHAGMQERAERLHMGLDVIGIKNSNIVGQWGLTA